MMVTFISPFHKMVTIPLIQKTSMMALYYYCNMRTNNNEDDYIYVFNGKRLTSSVTGFVNDQEESGYVLILKKLRIKHWTESDNIRYMTGFEAKECC